MSNDAYKIILSSDLRNGAITIWHLSKENAPSNRSNLIVLDIVNNHMADAYLTPIEAEQLAALLLAAADEAKRRMK